MDVRRRTVLGFAAAGLAGLGSAGAAEAADLMAAIERKHGGQIGVFASQAPPTLGDRLTPTPVNGVGYVSIDGVITWGTVIGLGIGLDGLADKGVKQIDILLNSPDGDLDAAAAVVASMNRLHTRNGITFKVWNAHLLATPATLIFLAAQQRYIFPTATFVFRAPLLFASGSFDVDTFRKKAERLDQIDHAMRDTLVARTHLTPEQAEIDVTRTVTLSAEQARTDGVVDGIDQLKLPTDAPVLTVRDLPPGTRIPGIRGVSG